MTTFNHIHCLCLLLELWPTSTYWLSTGTTLQWESVFDLLYSVDTCGSSSPECISGKMLKSTAHSHTPVITLLLTSVQTGSFPFDRKILNVVPIPNYKAEDNHSPSDYRPISPTTDTTQTITMPHPLSCLKLLILASCTQSVVPNGAFKPKNLPQLPF